MYLANDYYYDLIRYPKPQYEALFHSHCDEYFYNNPEGWAKLVETVNSALEQGKSGYSLYLPMVYPDGGTFWVRIQAVFYQMNRLTDTVYPTQHGGCDGYDAGQEGGRGNPAGF